MEKDRYNVVAILYSTEYKNKTYYSIKEMCLASKNDNGTYEIINGNNEGEIFPALSKSLPKEIKTCVMPFRINNDMASFLKDSQVINRQIISEYQNIALYVNSEGILEEEKNPDRELLSILNSSNSKKEKNIEFEEEFCKEFASREMKDLSVPKKITSEKDIKKIYEKVSENVVGQEKIIKKVLSAIAANAFYGDKRVVLIVGKTGTGKTEIVKQIAKQIKLPVVIEDATKFTSAGYVGSNVEDMLKDLYLQANKDIHQAEHGIIVIDEVDKLAQQDKKVSISTKAVQEALLKMLDGNEFVIRGSSFNDGTETFSIDTSNIIIIMCGAFSGLYDKKVTNQLGFNTKDTAKSESETTTPIITEKELKEYGLIPEFIGRITDIYQTKDYDLETIKKIIRESKISAYNQKKELYKSKGITLSSEEEFIDFLARKAMKDETGIRAIRLELNKIISEVEYDLQTENYNEIIISKEGIAKVRKKKNTNHHGTIANS